MSESAEIIMASAETTVANTGHTANNRSADHGCMLRTPADRRSSGSVSGLEFATSTRSSEVKTSMMQNSISPNDNNIIRCSREKQGVLPDWMEVHLMATQTGKDLGETHRHLVPILARVLYERHLCIQARSDVAVSSIRLSNKKGASQLAIPNSSVQHSTTTVFVFDASKLRFRKRKGVVPVSELAPNTQQSTFDYKQGQPCQVLPFDGKEIKLYPVDVFITLVHASGECSVTIKRKFFFCSQRVTGFFSPDENGAMTLVAPGLQKLHSPKKDGSKSGHHSGPMGLNPQVPRAGDQDGFETESHQQHASTPRGYSIDVDHLMSVQPPDPGFPSEFKVDPPTGALRRQGASFHQAIRPAELLFRVEDRSVASAWHHQDLGQSSQLHDLNAGNGASRVPTLAFNTLSPTMPNQWMNHLPPAATNEPPCPNHSQFGGVGLFDAFSPTCPSSPSGFSSLSDSFHSHPSISSSFSSPHQSVSGYANPSGYQVNEHQVAPSATPHGGGTAQTLSPPSNTFSYAAVPVMNRPFSQRIPWTATLLNDQSASSSLGMSYQQDLLKTLTCTIQVHALQDLGSVHQFQVMHEQTGDPLNVSIINHPQLDACGQLQFSASIKGLQYSTSTTVLFRLGYTNAFGQLPTWLGLWLFRIETAHHIPSPFSPILRLHTQPSVFQPNSQHFHNRSRTLRRPAPTTESVAPMQADGLVDSHLQFSAKPSTTAVPSVLTPEQSRPGSDGFAFAFGVVAQLGADSMSQRIRSHSDLNEVNRRYRDRFGQIYKRIEPQVERLRSMESTLFTPQESTAGAAGTHAEHGLFRREWIYEYIHKTSAPPGVDLGCTQLRPDVYERLQASAKSYHLQVADFEFAFRVQAERQTPDPKYSTRVSVCVPPKWANPPAIPSQCPQHHWHSDLHSTSSYPNFYTLNQPPQPPTAKDLLLQRLNFLAQPLQSEVRRSGSDLASRPVVNLVEVTPLMCWFKFVLPATRTKGIYQSLGPGAVAFLAFSACQAAMHPFFLVSRLVDRSGWSKRPEWWKRLGLDFSRFGGDPESKVDALRFIKAEKGWRGLFNGYVPNTLHRAGLFAALTCIHEYCLPFKVIPGNEDSERLPQRPRS